jgi:hypothetical protein
MCEDAFLVAVKQNMIVENIGRFLLLLAENNLVSPAPVPK